MVIYANLIGRTSIMAHNKSQGHQHSGSGEEYLKMFLPYMDHISYMDVAAIKTICIGFS